MCYSKLLIVSLFTFICVQLRSQYVPKGVTLLDNRQVMASFIYKDSRDNLWMGLGFLLPDGTRRNEGLKHYANGKWAFDFNSGKFTDAIERSGKMYFTSYDGLYIYDGTSFTLDARIKNSTSVITHQNRLYIGTMGNGLYYLKSSFHVNVLVKIGSTDIKNIYSLCSDGKYLWLGTSLGLVRYDGKSFKQFPETGSLQDSLRKDVIAVQRDGMGNIWMATKSSFRNQYLFRLTGDTFQSVTDYMHDICYRENDIPKYPQRLAVSKSGNILVGLTSGILEVTPYGFKRYYATVATQPYMTMRVQASGWVGCAVHCDKDGMLYNTGSIPAIIDPDLYSHESLDDPAKRHQTQNSLDINDIKAGFTNIGTLFNATDQVWDFLGRPVFDVPSIGCAKPMYASALWIGGMHDTSLHLAVEQYGYTGNFLPGPIDTVTMKYDSVASQAYNRIWKVSRFHIDEFRANYNKPGYVIPADILEWPAHGKNNFSRNLAPFVDVDKNGVYEPHKGDYPRIKGDQMLWCVFNDLGSRVDTIVKTMGVEIHASYYAYHCGDYAVDDSGYIMNRTIFCDYQVINKSKNDYNNVCIGMLNDVDIGNYADDYVACYVPENAGYGYNGDANDEGRWGFGYNPPVMICKFLNRKMSSFVSSSNSFDPIIGSPRLGGHYYNYMNGRWMNGVCIKYGGNGVNGSICTPYMYDNGSNPVTAGNPKWNELTTGNMPGDRRFVMSAQSPALKADSTMNLEFAYIMVYKPGVDLFTHFNEQPLQAMRQVQNWYDKHSFPSCAQKETYIDPVNLPQAGMNVYPNPASDDLFVELSESIHALSGMEVIDLMGKQVAYVAEPTQDKFIIHLGELPQGIYFARILSDNGWITRKFVKL